MKIAVMSDVHGNFSALQAVVADIARRGGVDEVVNLGNMVSGPLMPLQTAHFLMRQDWMIFSYVLILCPTDCSALIVVDGLKLKMLCE